MKRNLGNIYNLLGGHSNVQDFLQELTDATKCPKDYHPILVSIANQLLVKGYISNKQLSLALKLIQEQYRAK